MFTVFFRPSVYYLGPPVHSLFSVSLASEHISLIEFRAQANADFAKTFLTTFVSLALFQSLVYQAYVLAQLPEWTVMAYMSGDNNLESYISKDLETEFAAAGSSSSVNIVALADRAPGYDTGNGDWQTTKLFYVTKGMIANSASALADWGEKDMGDPATLIQFISWTKKNYPAKKYALFLWGHGWSWHPGYTLRDDTDRDTLDYHELKQVFNDRSVGFIDVIGFDGCNFASIEILELFQGRATAITASQEYVGWDGLEYETFLPQLLKQPTMGADQLAIIAGASATREKTWSSLATDSRYTALKTAVTALSSALISGLPTQRKNYDQAFTNTRSFWQAPADMDLYDMALNLKAQVTDTNIKNKCQAVMDAYSSIVLFERHVNSYSAVRGITINVITKAAQKDNMFTYYNSQIDFSRTTGWGSFLNQYAI
jgi:hypothetical protein